MARNRRRPGVKKGQTVRQEAIAARHKVIGAKRSRRYYDPGRRPKAANPAKQPGAKLMTHAEQIGAGAEVRVATVAGGKSVVFINRRRVLVGPSLQSGHQLIMNALGMLEIIPNTFKAGANLVQYTEAAAS